ncbi:MAG: Dabb family protein [Chitinophagaceae bacterium]
MLKHSRRKFLGYAGKLAFTAGFTTFAANTSRAMPATDFFIHHVYFWLTNPDNKQDRDKLVEGLKKLKSVKSIKTAHIGKPADTNRDVIDATYAISWLLTFDNRANQDSYQVDPIHLKFVEECKHLWSRVVVYDTVDV